MKSASDLTSKQLIIPDDAQFIKLSDDLTIRYQTAGSGSQVILLVPGWTMSAEVFERQQDYFKDSKTYRFIAIDPRSQGFSTHTREGNYYEQHGRDLGQFIEKLALKDIVLGGWSSGGLDILAYVNQFGSNNLKGLIMIDAAPCGTGGDNTKDWVWYSKDDFDGLRKSLTQGALLHREKMNDRFAREMVNNASAGYLEWINNIMNTTSNDIAALLNESSAYQDYTSDLKELDGKVNLLYVVTSRWKSLVTDWSREHTPSAKIEIFDKHLSFWEDYIQFNSVLHAFLKDLK
nr:alpha/beta hydrolase [Mesorhizobium sp. WSM4875]